MADICTKVHGLKLRKIRHRGEGERVVSGDRFNPRKLPFKGSTFTQKLKFKYTKGKPGAQLSEGH